MMKKKTLIVRIFIGVLIFTVLINFSSIVFAKDDFEFTNITFDDQYGVGEILSLPTVELVSGNDRIKADTVVYLPNGDAYKTNKIILEQFGKYTIEYRSVINKKLYSKIYEFIVIEQLFSFSSDKSSAIYDMDLSAYNTGIVGTNVTLQRGDVLKYNGVIDLRELDANTPAVELFVTPQGGFGTKDVKKINIEFIDIYDETNRIKVIGNAVDDDGDPGQWWASSTYMQAGAFDTTSGIEWGSGLVHTNNMWGYPARFSFYGMRDKRSVVGEEFLSVAFDLAEKQVFGPAGKNGNFIIDLDDMNYVSQPWDGFTTGEVYMTISADGYSGQSFDFVITKIGKNDISPFYNYDLVGPNIEIDYGMLDEADLPKAKVGFTYPVFSATAYDAVTKASDVKTRVFFNYFTKQRFELQIDNGTFSVNRSGVYTIEYKASDQYGNESIKLIHIETTTNEQKIEVEFDESLLPSSETVGSRVDIPKVSYQGGFGHLTLNIYAKLGTNIIPIENGFFRPAEAGRYEIVFEVIDSIGQKEISIHQLDVEANNLPVFIDDAIMPRYIIAGSNYELFNLQGFDYNISDYVDTEIYVTDGHGVDQLITGYRHNFKADANGQATITYRAINEHGFKEVSYVVDVVTVKDPHIDMTAYFIGDNLVKTAASNRVTLKNDIENMDASFEFANLLNGNQFTMKFRIDPLNSNLQTINLYLTDYEEAQQSIKISFIRVPNSNHITVEINNQLYTYNLLTTFINGGEISLSYNNLNQTLSINNSDHKPIIDYINQSKFEGFTSSRIYLSGEIKDVIGNAALQINSINGQLLSSDDADFVRPFVSVEGAYKSTYKYNEIATIFSALAFDVLDPEVVTSVTVKDQVGNIITSIDGILLDEVSFAKSYQVELSKYGSYLVTYKASDTNGSGTATFTYALYVADVEKPVIMITKDNISSVKRNNTFDIQPATANDAVDGQLSVMYFIILPTGEFIHIKADNLTFTPTLSGSHVIRYHSVDLSGNQVFVDHEVIVN